ncbi:MAG: YigZ family protein ['Candidatus Kapabacteria' thiocyanatum]|uniref:Impact N-terminal domain-containing protein n=1 Tax=Candidatus Kapaibacterium thiocyanatum TaxID=1895771 RepID=A0A1M3L2D5_9BACT|nr:YigZ family protein ['Candidatus Kapabacteria' thiocyanatum]OJX59321.1 MAG: hypothetical protein BGO89_02570 ['Candidatus Kapabacteria' thiocyanatum]
MATDEYWTVAAETRAEITIKRSVFLACALHSPAREDAMAYVERLRKEFFDAVHHCFAYRLGQHGLDYRMSDDGEPSGTAGKPILFCLQKAQLTDSVVVVVRYFGGIKLGTGGLARAYSEAATDVLASCPRRKVVQTRPLSIFCTYDDIARITGLLEELDIPFLPIYADAVTFDVDVPQSQVDFVIAQVTSRTNARAGYSLRD